MSHRLLPSLLLFLALGAAPAPAQEAPAGFSIRSGDRITLALFTAAGEEVEVVTGDRVVDLNGEVFLPYLGTVQVAGLDEAGLRAVLASQYGVFYPDAVVDLEVELRVNVTGAIRSPGQYFVDPTATIVDAISIAGGTTADLAVIASQLPANAREVRLVRDGQTYRLNLRPGEATDETLRLRVQSGDWIDVPYQARSRVREEIVFFGTVVSFLSSIATLILLVN